MLQFVPIITDTDLQKILDLQACNLAVNISPEQALEQGFLTVKHEFPVLKRMNDLEQGIMAKDGDVVAGYILAMSKACRNDIPILISMFDAFDQLSYHGKKLDEYHYIVVGQICVDEHYRGQGIFDKMYEAYRALLSPKYDFAITEIARRNHRSLRAHARVGFETIHEFTAPDGEEWNIVVWNW